MGSLHISLFGCLRVSNDGWSSELKLTRIMQSLLAYLLLQGNRTHPREVLTGLLWGENSQEKARACLNTALWRLRSTLEPDGVPPGAYLTTTQNGEVGFNWDSDYWLDMEIFQDRASQLLAVPCQAGCLVDFQPYEEAMRLYRGELLEGLYDDWVLRERERLLLCYLDCQAHLMDLYAARGDFTSGLLCGQRILDHDPLREEIHRALMRLYVQSGQRSLAVRQYRLCRQALKQELGIPPMRETQMLYQQVLADADEPGARLDLDADTDEAPGLLQALGHLRQAARSFEMMQEQFRAALQVLERFVDRHE